jgi:RNA polymerase sigma factor (sigma-70 family)
LAVIYLVDDDPSVLKAITRLLVAEGFETRPFASPKAFLSRHDTRLPGCIIMDVAMPDLSGLDLQELIAETGQNKPIIFISGNSDVATSVTAMKKGAVDFLIKPFTDESLLKAVRDAINKDRVRRKISEERDTLRKRLTHLTPREKEVLKLVIAGKLNKQIAAKLGIVEKTVKVHRARMMSKMCAKTLAELVHFAERLDASQAEADQAG